MELSNDEKLASEWIKNNFDLYLRECSYVVAKHAFIDSRKSNKPKWHTNPNDLPPMIQDERHISETVWINIENWGTEDGYYDYNKNCWIIRCRVVNLPILGWIEIPKWEI